MSKANYTEEAVLIDLKRKHDVRVVNEEVQLLTGPQQKGDLGIRTKGKIDFLRGKGYRVVTVAKFQ